MISIQTAVRTLLIYVALASPLAWAGTPTASDDTHRRCGGEPCAAVFRGFLAFFDRELHTLGGNGRACADCHMATDHFQLSPAGAEQRFQRLQRRREWNPGADDPLFRPIDADDFRAKGADANDFSNLRENGLIRVEFTLPPNMKLIDPATNAPSTETVVDIWRMVPSINNVKLTGPDGVNPWPRDPNRSGGYQLDARFTTLQDQALGALLSHAEIQNAPAQRLCPIRIRGSTRWSYRAGRYLCARVRSATAVPGSRQRRLLSSDTTTSPRSVRAPSIPSYPLASTSGLAPHASRATRGPTRSRCRLGP